MARRSNDLPVGARRGDDVTIGHGNRGKIVLEERERLHGARACGFVHDIYIGGMQVYGHLIQRQ